MNEGFVSEADRLAAEQQEKRDDAEIERDVRKKAKPERKHRRTLAPPVSDEPKRGPGRPKKWLVWRCDKCPNLRVYIPGWVENPALAQMPYAELLGTVLDTRKYAEYRHLTDKEVEQMNDILATTKFVRLATELRGAVYACDFCDFEAHDPKALAYHLAIKHAEELNIVPNRNI